MNIQCLCVSSTVLLGCLVSSTQAQCSPTELDKYLPFFDTNNSSGQFANSLAVSGDKAVTGAYGLHSNRGRIFFYTISGTQMIPHSSFRASGDGSGDNTGTAVAIDGDIAVIGAPYDDDFGSKSGSAYIFRYDGVNWNQEAKLLPSDGAANDYFGDAVAISGNVVVIGARHESGFSSPAGAAYVFRYDGASWVEEAKLLASDGADDDQFGFSVAVEGDTIVVGAEFDHIGDEMPPLGRNGSAYIFQHDGASWAQHAKLVEFAGGLGDESNSSFGFAVAISGDRIAIGQKDGLIAGGFAGGAVYIYDTDGAFQNRIVASDGQFNSDFGDAVALDGDTLVVGASADNFEGAAYLYKFDGASWIESAKMVSADIANGDRFGNSVAISGDTLLIGATADDDQGGNSGSFYTFDQGCAAPCPADLDGDGTLDFFDVSAFLAAFANQDPIADFNSDGLFDFFDVSDFLAAFAAGCP